MIKYFILSITYILLFINNGFCICQGIASGFGYKDNPLPSAVINTGTNGAGNKYDFEGKKDYLVFDVIPDETYGDACPMSVFTLGFKAVSEITGINSQNACGSKVVWVDSASYSKYDGSSEIRACASQCGWGVHERCITLAKGTSITSTFGVDLSKLWAKEMYFSGSNTGFNPAVSSTDHRYGHRVGYLYNLYSATCPYSTKTLDVEGCLAVQKGFSGEIGDYYKGVKYNRNNNCYELVKSKAILCQSPDTCKCVNDASHGNCSSSSNYLPDKNSTYWISLKANVKTCFLCYSNIRLLLNYCVNASYDKGYGYGQHNTYSESFKTLISKLNKDPMNQDYIAKYNIFSGLYGPGLYICAYETPQFNMTRLAVPSVALADVLLKSQESGDQLSRVGCKKIKTKSGPRPFPRIARPAPSDVEINGKRAFFVFPATNLFITSPRVKKFNDIAINGSCDGKLEVGEKIRGDFYNPSLIIRYGLNNTAIWFNPKNDSTFVSKYTTTQTKSFSGHTYSDTDKEREKISEWSTFNGSEAKPIIVSYGMPSQTGGSCAFDVSTELNLQDRICARIEYDESRQKDFFVAYVVKNKNTPDKNCSQLFEDGDLNVLGGVARPPLKYDYDINQKKTVTQIAMSEPVATDRSSQVLISLKPLPNGGYMQQNGEIASFYKSDGSYTDAAYAIMGKVKLLTFTSLSLSADATTSAQSPSDENNCAYILNHKICIGPFLGFDCQALNANTDNPIRESIRYRTTTSCPTSDTACEQELKLFNRIYSQCIKLKRCPVSSTENQEGCKLDGAMKIKIYTTDPDDLSVNYTTSDYYYNYNWSDGICVVSGISQVEFGDHGTHVPEYEDYGNLTIANDSVITFVTNLDSTKISARTTGSFTDTGAENIITPSDSFFKESNATNARLSLYNTLGPDLVAKYFGSWVKSSEDLVNKISVRRKNFDDMGLCVVFDRVNQIQYGDGGGNYKDGGRYNFYVPYKCDYLEAQTLGAGGKSEQWSQNGRAAYVLRTAGECIGWSLACTFGVCTWSWFIDGGDSCDECYSKVTDLCTRYLQSGSGSGGGYAHAILDINKIDRDVLIIQPGEDNTSDVQFYDVKSSDLPDVRDLLTTDPDRLKRPSFDVDSVIWRTSYKWNSNTINLVYKDTNNTAIINGNGGMHKPYDDRGTIGRGGHYDEGYIVPSGYGNCGVSDTALPVMPTEPEKNPPSIKDKEDYYNNTYPVITKAESDCKNNTNTCCNQTNKNTYNSTVCLKLSSTSVDGCSSIQGKSEYCCLDQTCKKEMTDRDTKMKEESAKVMTTEEYNKAKAKYEEDLKTYMGNKKSYNQYIENNFMNTFYANMCPLTVTGEDGEYDFPGDRSEVLFNGGGNVAIKALNYVKNNCTTADDDMCIRYRMTKNYCNRDKILDDVEYEDKSRLGWNENASKSDMLIKNKFRGSGGCARDHGTVDLTTSADADNDGTDDKEAWGGIGWIRLAIPYVQYADITGVKPNLSNGHKVLDKQKGMRDLSCVPRCPRAFIKIENKVCEYSNGDPARGYETAVNGNVSPLKCFDSDGNISIPTSGFGRTCLFTRCGDDYKKSYRYNGFCGANMSIYVGNIFISGAGFYTDLAHGNETLKYCGLLANSANEKLYTLDSELSGNKYLMTCDDHGNWRLSSNTTIKANYACPTIKPSFFNTIDIIKSLDKLSKIPETEEFNEITNSSTYCGGYGLFKPKE